MNNQFFGDERDFYKYALLRVLSDGGKNSIGVCWLLTECGTSGGGKLGYLRRDSYKQKDSDLHHFLRDCICKQKLRDVSVMDANIIPGAKYFSRSFSAADRSVYFQQAANELGGCSLIFFDPDTGIKPKYPSKPPYEYIRPDEIGRMWQQCEQSSLLLFQYSHLHFGSAGGQKRHENIMRQLSPICGKDNIRFFYQCQTGYYFMIRNAIHKEKFIKTKQQAIYRLGFV